MDGVTNYSDADFQQVECGCADRTVTSDEEESDGDDGGLDSVEIGIAVAGAALLLALVGACAFAYSKRKRRQEEGTFVALHLCVRPSISHLNLAHAFPFVSCLSRASYLSSLSSRAVRRWDVRIKRHD